MIDDDAVIRKLGMFAFGKLGQFDIRQAGSGRQALEMLESWTPDVIVLDVMMPEMDGKETYRQIKAKFPHLKIVFMTGQELPEQVAELKALGALGVLIKPFDPKEIAKKVHDLLDSNP
jgi:CheY-like chemotaxis protein